MVAERRSVNLTGPSDGGKSTFLNVLGALDKPTRWSVFINGQDMVKIEIKTALRKRVQ